MGQGLSSRPRGMKRDGVTEDADRAGVSCVLGQGKTRYPQGMRRDPVPKDASWIAGRASDPREPPVFPGGRRAMGDPKTRDGEGHPQARGGKIAIGLGEDA